MTNEIKISIIIPCYNVEKYLNECLDSLVNQTFKDFEIICVDDGSSDNTLLILKQYEQKYPYIKVITQENQYAGVARNNGMKHAQGEYLLFLDSDDFFELDMLEKVYDKAISTKADIVLFDGSCYCDIEKKSRENKNFLHTYLLKDLDTFSKENTDLVYQITTPSLWTKLFNKELIFKNKIQFSQTKNSNDIYFSYLALAHANKISFINEKMVHYRINTSVSLQDNFLFNTTYIFDALLDTYYELKRKNLYTKNIEKSFVNAVVSNIFYNYKKIGYLEDQIEFVRKLVDHELYQEVFLPYRFDFYMDIHNIKRNVKYLNNLIYAIHWKDKYLNKTYDETYKIIESKYQNSNPAISVIIPVYNTQNYLVECLDSIVNQTFSNFEVILVNDGSTDDSLKILKDFIFKDISFKLIDYKDNRGISYARNIGIKKAKGEYLYIMDSDDFLEKRGLEKLYNESKINDLDILFFDAKTIYDNEKMQDKHSNTFTEKYIRKEKYTSVTTGINLVIEQIKNSEYLMNVPLQFTKRSFFLENDFRFINGIIYEDNFYTFNSILFAKKVSHLNEKLYNRRIRSESIMTANSSFYNVYSYFINYQNMLEKIISLNLNSNEKKQLWVLIDDILRRSRGKYIKLINEEREIYKFLDDSFKIPFKNLVVDYVSVKEKFNETNKIKEKLEIKLNSNKSELSKIKKSKSYKLSEKISKLLRVFKK